MFSNLQLSAFANFHSTMYKLASALRPAGVLVFEIEPSDRYGKNASSHDETEVYVLNCSAPFVGEDLPTFS